MHTQTPTSDSARVRRRSAAAILIALVVLVAGVLPAAASPAGDAPDEFPRRAQATTRRVDPVLVSHVEQIAARAEFLSLTSAEKKALSRTPAEIAVATALAQQGKPYRRAGKGPDRFDCSGLTGFAWAAAGVPLPPSSRTQYAQLPHVSLDELEPGDLLFRGSPIHHVSMYIGDDLLVHAPQTGDVVKIAPVDYGRLVGAARPWEGPAV